MATLISQNAIPKGLKRNANKDENRQAREADDGQELDLDEIKNRKRRRDQKKKDEALGIEQEKEMKKLENFLFGSLYSPIEFGKDTEETRDEVDNSSALFFTDRSANSMLSVYEGDAQLVDETSDEEEVKEKKPVWVDEEEEKTSINIAKVNKLRKLRKEEDESVISGSSYVSRLRAQHAKMNPGTDWARPETWAKAYSSDDEDLDQESGPVVARGYEDAEGIDDILKRNEDLVVKNSAKLLPGRLEYSRLVDANVMERSNGPIKSVQFHKNAQLLLTAGLDKTLRFFQIDGKKNANIQSIFLDGYPIYKASFLPDGSQVIISGRRKFAYGFDLVTTKKNEIGPLVGRDEKSLESFEVSPDSSTIAFLGNEGYILLVSTKTKELIGTLKMNGTVRSLAFTNDGSQLLSSGGDGHIYHFDLRTRTCFHKGVDEGCVTGTALCTSSTGNLFAAGSDSGAVNVYNGEDFLGGKRKPLKTLNNLQTQVNFMKFNHDSQILAICSNMKKSSLKLVHVPSFTAFSNWPPLNQTLHHTNCLDFSPHGGFMALGNAAGKVLLYKLHHYHNA